MFFISSGKFLSFICEESQLLSSQGGSQVSAGLHAYLNSGAESASKLIQVQLLVVVGLRSSLPC